jgi:hypothetical protein
MANFMAFLLLARFSNRSRVDAVRPHHSETGAQDKSEDSPGAVGYPLLGTMSIRVQVECYAGYRGEETPRRFRVGSDQNRQVEVAEVLDRWLAPDHRYFKVLGDDGALYILRHDVTTWEWELTLFQSGR